ncbi:MAG TPA: Gx transporter family protein [Candidatus Faecivivens stercoravium]|uniref:Gx transporter family protein n=1 Tax=Candidatus Faecivivens stercoravium TaxID=2840803 RepID=A0A9D1DX85_9FIRM|nr:Gx transporter family protein [Candidatus Faecivivens stercoravium]
MGSRNSKARRVALYGMLTALAFILSYVESLVPVTLGIPGVKLGLANLVVVIALYTLDLKGAFVISVVRIVLSGLTFGGLLSMLYSLAGGLFSFAVMAILSRKKVFGTVGVSVCGGVAHNIGQLLVAMAVLETESVWYYFPVLLISGSVAGVLIGLLGGWMTGRVQDYLAKRR